MHKLMVNISNRFVTIVDSSEPWNCYVKFVSPDKLKGPHICFFTANLIKQNTSILYIGIETTQYTKTKLKAISQ